MAGTSITFNSLNLNDGANIITSDIDDSAPFEKNIFTRPLAGRHGGVVSDPTIGTKPIIITGTIKGSGMVDLESRVNSFKASVNAENANLDIGYNGTTLRYVCSLARDVIRRPVRGANWARFELLLIATEYGKDTTATTLYNNDTHTTSSATKSCVVGGNAPEQFLRIEVTVTALTTSVTSNTISIENDTTGQTVSITRSWSASDVLEVDPFNNTVKVNGTGVDYSGSLPIFSPGTHDLIITNDFSTRTLSLDVDYYKRYR